MKGWLGKLPLILTLLLTAVVLAIWVRTYIIGDRYRWVSLHEQGDTAWVSNRSITTGFGGLAVLSEQSEPTNNDRIISGIKKYLASPRDARPGYMVFRSPRYPLTARDPWDETMLNSLGIHFSSTIMEDSRGLVHRLEMTVPFWAIFALTAAYPIACYVAGVVRRQRDERGRKHTCPRCGEVLADTSTRCDCCDLPIALAREG